MRPPFNRFPVPVPVPVEVSTARPDHLFSTAVVVVFVVVVIAAAAAAAAAVIISPPFLLLLSIFHLQQKKTALVFLGNTHRMLYINIYIDNRIQTTDNRIMPEQ